MTVERSVPIHVANANIANEVSSVSLLVSAPLPVLLHSFSAKEQPCGMVALNWKSTSEQDLAQYNVAYRNDGYAYETVTSLKADNAANGAQYGIW